MNIRLYNMLTMEKNAADALTRALRYKQTHEKTVQNIQNQLANVLGKPGKEDVQAMLTKQLKNANSKLQNAEKTINSAPKSRVEGAVSHIQNVDKSNKNMSRLLENVENSRKSQLGSITHKDDVLDAYKHQIDAAKNKLNKPQEESGGLLSRIKNAITGKKTEQVDRNALESKIKELESGMKSRNDLLDRDPRFANQKGIESDRINSSAENLSNSLRNQIRQDMSESASKSRQLDNKNSFGYDKRVKQKALDEEKALYNKKMEETARENIEKSYAQKAQYLKEQGYSDKQISNYQDSYRKAIKDGTELPQFPTTRDNQFQNKDIYELLNDRGVSVKDVYSGKVKLDDVLKPGNSLFESNPDIFKELRDKGFYTKDSRELDRILANRRQSLMNASKPASQKNVGNVKTLSNSDIVPETKAGTPKPTRAIDQQSPVVKENLEALNSPTRVKNSLNPSKPTTVTQQSAKPVDTKPKNDKPVIGSAKPDQQTNAVKEQADFGYGDILNPVPKNRTKGNPIANRVDTNSPRSVSTKNYDPDLRIQSNAESLVGNKPTRNSRMNEDKTYRINKGRKPTPGVQNEASSKEQASDVIKNYKYEQGHKTTAQSTATKRKELVRDGETLQDAKRRIDAEKALKEQPTVQQAQPTVQQPVQQAQQPVQQAQQPVQQAQQPVQQAQQPVQQAQQPVQQAQPILSQVAPVQSAVNNPNSSYMWPVLGATGAAGLGGYALYNHKKQNDR